MLDAAHGSRLHADQPDAVEHLGCYCNSPRIGWIVAVTHPQAEDWADRNLLRRGYHPFLPRYAARVRDRVVPSMFHIVSRPLFAGYIFVPHDSRDSWRPIYETPGVRSVLKNGNQIQYANAGAVEAVRASEDARRTYPTTQAPRWPTGAAVRVSKGIFQGHGGVVLSADADTARVGVMFLGQLRQVSLPAEFLTARDE